MKAVDKEERERESRFQVSYDINIGLRKSKKLMDVSNFCFLGGL
jgi:hypothetical protein